MSLRAGTCACGRTIVIRDDDEHPGVCDICHLQQALAAEREKLAELQDRSVAMRKHERRMRKTLEDALAAERERAEKWKRIAQEDQRLHMAAENDMVRASRERDAAVVLAEKAEAEKTRLARIIRELQVEGPEDVQALRVTIVRLENDLAMVDKALHDAADLHKAEVERLRGSAMFKSLQECRSHNAAMAKARDKALGILEEANRLTIVYNDPDDLTDGIDEAIAALEDS